MCGICGFISKKNISLAHLSKMNDTMYHRGPDDHGEEIFHCCEYNIGLAQRRLSILDLSINGHQPMHSFNNSIKVIFNGEIYNHAELRKELGEYPYKSSSDTEVIIAAYDAWGIEFVHHIKGMFAIALWDDKKKKLYLVRDRIGKKPLYYWNHTDEIIFASELKPILSCDWFDREINRSILRRFLFQQYINAPDTIFVNVFKLEPGTYICCDMANGLQISKTVYWDIVNAYHKEHTEMMICDFASAKRGLEEKIMSSVKNRLTADVPIGCLLSGGIDSSLITAMAQKLSEQPVRTFTIGINDKKYNEAVYAKETADYLGTLHTELYIDEREMMEQVESISECFDEPFADASQIPTMLVSKLARKNVTVVLSGDGGDEFFCGYEIYDRVRQAQQLEVFSKLASAAGNVHLGKRYVKHLYPSKVRKLAGNRDIETQAQLNPDILLDTADSMVLHENDIAYLPCQYRQETRYKVKDWVVKRMLLNMQTSLPGDMLCKVDRASMKYSLEVRNPLLDTDVMEYSFRIPQKFKMHEGEKKYILKQIAYDYIPQEILDRPKKGFSVPVADWLRGLLRESLLSYCEHNFLVKQGLFCAEYVEKTVYGFLENKFTNGMTDPNLERIIWSFYVFQQWYVKYIGS